MSRGIRYNFHRYYRSPKPFPDLQLILILHSPSPELLTLVVSFILSRLFTGILPYFDYQYPEYHNSALKIIVNFEEVHKEKGAHQSSTRCCKILFKYTQVKKGSLKIGKRFATQGNIVMYKGRKYCSSLAAVLTLHSFGYLLSTTVQKY